MLVQVRGDSGTRDLALIDADVVSVRTGDGLHHLHGEGGGLLEFEQFGIVEFGDESDVTVRANHEMPDIVWVEVHDGEHVRATPGDEAVFVGFFGSGAERAFLRLGLGWAILAVAQHIGHALRSPQSFDRVLLRRKVRRIIDTHVSHFRTLSWLPSLRGAVRETD